MDDEITYRRHPNAPSSSHNNSSPAKIGGGHALPPPQPRRGSTHKARGSSNMTVEYTRQATEEETSFRNSRRGGRDDDDDDLDRPLINNDDESEPPSSPMGSRQSSTTVSNNSGKPKHSDTYYAILGAYCTMLDKLLTPSMAAKLAAEVTPSMRYRLQLFVRPIVAETQPTKNTNNITSASSSSTSCLPPFPADTGLAVRYSHANKHHSQQLRQLWWCMDNFFHRLESSIPSSSDGTDTTTKRSDSKETPSTLIESIKAPMTPFEKKSTSIVIHTGVEDKGDAGSPVLTSGMNVVDREAYARKECVEANGGVAIISERWKRLGFQGCDPATDFRGSGLMALRQMIQMFDSYPEILERIFTDSEMAEVAEDEEGDSNDIPLRRQCCEYPFAAACVNITMHLLMLLSIEPHRTESGDAAAATCITAETARHSYTTLRASYNLCNIVAGSDNNTSVSSSDHASLLKSMETTLGEIFMLSVVVMHEHWCLLPPNSRNLLLFNTEVLKKSRLVMEVILREAETIDEVRDRIRRGGAAGKTSPFSGLL